MSKYGPTRPASWIVGCLQFPADIRPSGHPCKCFRATFSSIPKMPSGSAGGNGIPEVYSSDRGRRRQDRGRECPESDPVLARGQKRLRVRMQRSTEQILRRRMLDDPAQIHDRHFGSDVFHHRKIVADEEISQSEVATQFRKQIEDLSLHRHVQGARRLVAHDDARLQHEGTRDRHTLPLTPESSSRNSFGRLAAVQPAPAFPSPDRSAAPSADRLGQPAAGGRCRECAGAD